MTIRLYSVSHFFIYLFILILLSIPVRFRRYEPRPTFRPNRGFS
jgi:hypothetical protein